MGAALDAAFAQVRSQQRGLGKNLPVSEAQLLHHRQFPARIRARGNVQLRQGTWRMAEYLTRFPAHERFHQLKRLARRGKGGDAQRLESSVAGAHRRRLQEKMDSSINI